MKLSLGEGGFQGFLIRHCEKMALGLAILLMLGFVYWGWNIEPYSETPEDLNRLVEQARANIGNSTWSNYKDERMPVSNYATRVDQGRVPIQHHEYAMPRPLKPAPVRNVVKRSDPQLFPPTQLEVDAVVGPVAAPSKGKPDLLALKETATVKVEEKKPRRTNRRRRRPENPYGFGEDAGGIPSSGMFEEDDDYPMGGEYDFEGGSETPAAGGTRRVPGSWAEGWRPPMATQGAGQAPKIVPQSRNLIAIKALVPYEQQFDEFQRVLENTHGYDPGLDRPKFLAFVAQRAEVGNDPDAPLNWTKISSTGLALKEVREWVAAGSEQVDPSYLLPNVLTMPVPPLMMRSHRHLFGHSELPRKNAAKQAPTESDDDSREETPQDNQRNPDLPEDLPGFAGQGRAGQPGYAGMGAPGMAGPGGAMEGMDPGMMMPGYGSEEGSGAGAMGGNMYPGQQVTRYKLIRFYDMTAEPGKTYVYRVQVWLQDPNRSTKERSINPRVLEPEVIARLKQVAEEEKSAGYRIFYRKTEWSDHSSPISLPSTRRVYAGQTQELRRSQVLTTETGARMQIEEPAGKMVAVNWDPRYAVDVALESDVKRGAVLNAQKDIDVVHPVSLDFKTLDDYRFRTDAVVLDIRGGEELEGSRENPIYSLGNYIVFNPDGSLKIHNELEEIDQFRRFTYADEQKASSSSGGMGDEAGYPGMDGYDDMMEEGPMPMGAGDSGRRGRNRSRRGGFEN